MAVDLATAPVIGTISPMDDGLDLPYWDGLGDGVLRVQQCSECALWIWAPQWICRRCHSVDPPWVATPMDGVVYSWTRTWHPFAPNLTAVVPYVTVLVTLPAAGDIRLLGLLVGEHAEVAIGRRVAGVIQPASELTSGLPILRWALEAEDR